MDIDPNAIPFKSYLIRGDLQIAGPHQSNEKGLVLKGGQLKISVEIPFKKIGKYRHRIFLFFNESSKKHAGINPLHYSKKTETHLYYIQPVTVIAGSSIPTMTTHDTNHICVAIIDRKKNKVVVWQTSVVVQREHFFLRTQKITEGVLYKDIINTTVIDGLDWYTKIRKHITGHHYLRSLTRINPVPVASNYIETIKLPDNTGTIITWNEAYGKGIVLTNKGYARMDWKEITGNGFCKMSPGQKVKFKKITEINPTQPFHGCYYEVSDISLLVEAEAAPNVDSIKPPAFEPNPNLPLSQ